VTKNCHKVLKESIRPVFNTKPVLKALSNRNVVHEEIDNGLNSGEVRYYYVDKLSIVKCGRLGHTRL
jgi:hypothetical protein